MMVSIKPHTKSIKKIIIINKFLHRNDFPSLHVVKKIKEPAL
jgi:hypothetical protein